LNCTLGGADVERLEDLLEEARKLGFLGPGPVDQHITHSLAFARLVSEPPGLALDLGSGGGLPGLPLAFVWPRTAWVLLDANVKRTAWLADAVRRAGLGERVTVRRQRAEEAGRGDLRGQVDLVVARSFGPPAVTAECAAPLLRPGGFVVVAEPPGGDTRRWPADPLSQLGLEAGATLIEPVALQQLRQTRLCADRYPRRVGLPSKRPLFA
jgi:16S rRNA (guanine527-N7)-methyltransferase